MSEEDERDIAKPLTTRRGLAYTYLVNEQVDLDLCINNVKISPASSCKFLGLAIARYLSWKTHISNVIRKVYKGIFVLKQTSSSLGKRHNLLVYNAFIQSHLSYGVLVCEVVPQSDGMG